MAWNDQNDKDNFAANNPDIMEQQPKVEFGYFENRKEKFKTELAKGFTNGFGADNMTEAPAKKKKKPAAKKANSDNSDAPAPKAKAAGNVDLPKAGTPGSEWTDAQREAFKTKMAAARKAKKSK